MRLTYWFNWNPIVNEVIASEIHNLPVDLPSLPRRGRAFSELARRSQVQILSPRPLIFGLFPERG